jgi:hypothetical protein
LLLLLPVIETCGSILGICGISILVKSVLRNSNIRKLRVAIGVWLGNRLLLRVSESVGLIKCRKLIGSTS